ncbi:MAG TPA: TolC family protein [Gemmatimonadaceae bacterium]|nr:TolC family protein [Gemmatimonadaceae bacterium]
MRSMRLVALLAIPAQLAFAQAPARSELTLEDAIATAHRNNPNYLTTENNLRNSVSQVRQAYSALLPSANTSFSTRYQQGGTQFVQGVAIGGSGDTYQSSYQLGLSYNINGAVAFAPRAARAGRDAAEADITSAAALLRSQVTTQYIQALKSQAQADLTDSLLSTATGQLDLANAKMAVGAATIVDVRNAEVGVGQAQVNQVIAHNNAQIDKVRLFQLMGVPANPDAKLTTTFSTALPSFSLDSLLALAHKVNPDLEADKSRQYAAQMNVRSAQMSYLPSLFVSTGWGGNSLSFADDNFLINQRAAQAASGFASCLSADSLRSRVGLSSFNCGSPTLTQAQIDQIRSGNNQFPFKFDRNPIGIGATLSFPIFNNYQREAQVEQARVQRDNATYSLRARNLQLTTDVTNAYLTLIAAAKTVQLQEQTAMKAAQELAAVQERYKVGATTFLDVTTSRGQYEQAQIGRVNAIYDYHTAFANLEQAVGRPLR